MLLCGEEKEKIQNYIKCLLNWRALHHFAHPPRRDAFWCAKLQVMQLLKGPPRRLEEPGVKSCSAVLPLDACLRWAAAEELWPRKHLSLSLLAPPKQGLILQRQLRAQLPGRAGCRSVGSGFGLSQLCFPFSESPSTAAVCNTSWK